MKVFKSLTLVAALSVIVMTLQGNGCFGGNDVTGINGGGSGSGINKYDGSYTFSINGCTWHNQANANRTVACEGNGLIMNFPNGFVITNGNINAGFAHGSVTDFTFGNVRMTGACPEDATGTAVFTGILNVGSLNKFGQGQYTCSGGQGSVPGYFIGINGYSSTWRVNS